jgi:hypothetical protein
MVVRKCRKKAALRNAANIAFEILFIGFSALLNSDAAAPRIVAALPPDGLRSHEFGQSGRQPSFVQFFARSEPCKSFNVSA